MSVGADAEQWDVFISHASEDKERVARPLAAELQKAGLRVWLDAQELTLGDSLRQRIDDGLRKSRFGAVILSDAFFAKDWPQRELNALLALESGGRKVLLPVLHGLSPERLTRFSPLLADKLSASTDRGLQYVAIEIVKAIGGVALDAPAASDVVFEPRNLQGRSIGAYKLGVQLGAGGSGVVYRGSHKDLGDQLAIKLFYPLAPQFADFDRLFDRGLRALSRLSNPNIISAKDFGRVEIDGSMVRFLVMDHIAGPHLQEWSKALESDPNAFRKRLSAAQQIVQAMVAAHETTYVDDVGFEVTGVLHGDLKPSNILIGPGDVPTVLDFLLVDVQRLLDPRIMPSVDTSTAMTCTQALGTPGFMAPEQAQQGIVSTSTDVYGLGITFCHLFFPSHHAPQMAMVLDKDLPQALRELLKAMTMNDRQRRLASMREVALRLQTATRARGWRGLFSSLLRR